MPHKEFSPGDEVAGLWYRRRSWSAKAFIQLVRNLVRERHETFAKMGPDGLKVLSLLSRPERIRRSLPAPPDRLKDVLSGGLDGRLGPRHHTKRETKVERQRNIATL